MDEPNLSEKNNARKQIDNYLELVRFATRERFALLPIISTLAATFLVVATFNEQLIVLTFLVRFLLAVLLALVVLSLDAYFWELLTAEKHGMFNAGEISEKIFNVNIAEVHEETKKRAPKFSALRGHIPQIVLIVLNIVTVILILLVLGVPIEKWLLCVGNGQKF